MFFHVPDAEQKYNPNHLLDTILKKLQLKNDSALAPVLDVDATTLQNIRNKKASISASLLIRMSEVTGLSISVIRNLMGDRRSSYRVGTPQIRAPKGKPSTAAAAKKLFHSNQLSS